MALISANSPCLSGPNRPTDRVVFRGSRQRLKNRPRATQSWTVFKHVHRTVVTFSSNYVRTCRRFLHYEPSVDLTESILTIVESRLNKTVLVFFDQCRTPKSVLNNRDEIFVRNSFVDYTLPESCTFPFPRDSAEVHAQVPTIIRTYIIIS